VTLDFLSPSAAAPTQDQAPVARSPMERMARAAGGRFEIRDGWSVAVEYPGGLKPPAWADVSHLTKLEFQGEGVLGELGIASGDGPFGTATRAGDGWLCPLTATRALAIGVSPDGIDPNRVVDVTCAYAALTILGPGAREVIARFCAADLRPQAAPPGSFRPGSIGRQPGLIVCEGPERFLLLFGWAVGEYMWSVVEDAARSLGGAPIGAGALDA
jgi:glycine cleavage system aminomethyltransferase T